jgi:hypothetical protein
MRPTPIVLAALALTAAGGVAAQAQACSCSYSTHARAYYRPETRLVRHTVWVRERIRQPVHHSVRYGAYYAPPVYEAPVYDAYVDYPPPAAYAYGYGDWGWRRHHGWERGRGHWDHDRGDHDHWDHDRWEHGDD